LKLLKKFSDLIYSLRLRIFKWSDEDEFYVLLLKGEYIPTSAQFFSSLSYFYGIFEVFLKLVFRKGEILN